MPDQQITPSIDQCKNKIAALYGYPSWNKYYDWIARDGQLPGVVAQLIEAATEQAMIEYYDEALSQAGKNETMIIQYLERRIKELNKADSEFCADRWNMSKPQFERYIAREMSNQVTFARQELQTALKQITKTKGKNPYTDQTLFYLSELIRTVSRIVNKFPDVLFEDDLNRLNQAKAILAKHANTDPAEILSPSAPVTENTPKATFDRLQCEKDLLLMFRGYDFPERIKSLVDYCENLTNNQK